MELNNDISTIFSGIIALILTVAFLVFLFIYFDHVIKKQKERRDKERLEDLHFRSSVISCLVDIATAVNGEPLKKEDIYANFVNDINDSKSDI